MIRYFKVHNFKESQNVFHAAYQANRKLIHKCKTKYTTYDLISCSSRLIGWFCFCGRIFKQSDVCLERSISLAYALTYMGIPAELVIGKSYYCITSEYSFHAWVEIDGISVNERSDITRQWKPICKYPGAKAS